MALQVWLPLNGNLNNQGLSTWSFSTSTATVNSGGKIGNCYSFSATSGNGIYASDNGFMNQYINEKSFTLCAWVKSTASDTCVISLSYGLRLFAGSSPCISLYNSSRTITAYSNKSTTDGNWHHIAATYDNTTNVIRIYIDGVLSGSANYTSGYIYSSSWTNGLYIGRDPNNNTANAHYFYQGLMNDVRIYDNCLSASEVKDISKGLVLHYPLNQSDINKNYFGTEYSLNQEIRLNDYSTAGSFTQFYKMTVPMSTFAGKQMTFSYEVRCESGNTDMYDLYNSNGSPRYLIQNGSNFITGKGIGKEWKKLICQFTVSGDRGSSYSDSDSNKIEIYCPSGRPVYVRNMKLEEGWNNNPVYTHPNNTNTIVYDCSGYGNNGTVTSTSTPIIVNDSRRYSVSSKFDTTSKYISVPNIPATSIANSYTIAWWGKTPSYNMFWGFSNGNRLNIPYCGYYCNTGDGSDNPFYKPGTTTGISQPSANVWHHFACVGNGTDVKLYVDGVHYGTAKTYKPITGTSLIINGWDTGTSYKVAGMQMNDFRIYSTALSAEDIQELYNTSAKISKNGTLMCYELKEV